MRVGVFLGVSAKVNIVYTCFFAINPDMNENDKSLGVMVIVFNDNFNNISDVSWWSVLLVDQTRVPRENHQPVTRHWQTLSHNVISSTPRHELDSNSQLEWWYALITQVMVNPTTIRSRPQQPLRMIRKCLNWKIYRHRWI